MRTLEDYLKENEGTDRHHLHISKGFRDGKVHIYIHPNSDGDVIDFIVEGNQLTTVRI